MAQGCFLGGSGHRAVVHMCPAVPKMSWDPSEFVSKGAPQVPGDKPNLSEEARGTSSDEAHLTRTVQLTTWLAEMWPNNWTGAPIMLISEFRQIIGNSGTKNITV